ncbi:MAG: cation diffusion facilitator family transporter [Flavobacteriales bacterium]
MQSFKKAERILVFALVISTLLMAAKFIAFWRTDSNAILSDALESIINVAAQLFAIFSLRSARKPGDTGHLYGHGKFEFLSAGFEGALIFIAGVAIIVRSSFALAEGNVLYHMNEGLIIAGIAGVVNGAMAWVLIKQSKKLHSSALEADGHHLLSDTLTSFAMLIGLAVVYFTNLVWIDAAVSILFALLIMFTGYRLLRSSVGRLLDETDHAKVQEIIQTLESKRKDEWIDIHEFRLLKFGNTLHIDCHITLPFYMSIKEAHVELEAIEKVISEESTQPVEVYMHTDPCRPGKSCAICSIKTCTERMTPFARKIEWNKEALLKNEQHHLT